MALYASKIQWNIYAIGSFDTFRGASSHATDSTKGIPLNLYCARDPFPIPIRSYIIYGIIFDMHGNVYNVLPACTYVFACNLLATYVCK